DALTISFKTDAAKTQIFRYDPSLSAPLGPINTATGLPIYVISSTGHDGAAVKRVVTEVIQKPVNVLCKGAFVAGHDIDFAGNAVVCGWNHSPNTPPWTGEDGRITPPASKPCQPYELPMGSGELYGSWTTGGTNNGGTAFQNGFPTANASGQVGFYTGPWDAFAIQQADFYSWIGAPKSTMPTNLNAITYLDNDGIGQNQSGSWACHGVTGEGMLYVDGDL